MRLYDAFLSYNAQDRQQITRLADLLNSRGVKPFFDRIHVQPGDLWQESLELALQTSAACVVCIGSGGIGPWENEEVRVAIEQRVADPTFRVIPVLLPGAPINAIQMPPFLRRHHTIAFSTSVDEDEPLSQLAAAIRVASNTALSPDSHAGSAKRLICLSGPSAIGKDVLLHRLMSRARADGLFCDYLQKFTTREPRADETHLSPFKFVSLAQFQQLLASGRIACHRYSYGNHYGIDSSFTEGVKYGELLFVSQRLYREMQGLRELASAHGIRLFAVLITADHRSLMARTLHRSLSAEQRRHRTQQLVEDLELLDEQMDEISPLFNLVVNNGDHRPIATVEKEIWAAVSEWLRSDRSERVAS